MKKAVMTFEKTDCLDCKFLIESQAKRIRGIETAEVYLSQNKVVLEYHDSVSDPVEKMKDFITKIGITRTDVVRF